MNRLELGLALGIAYALGRRSGRSRQPLTARTPAGAHDPAFDRLKAEAWAYAVVRAQPLLAALGRRLGVVSLRLKDVADGNSPGFARLALAVGRHVVRSGAPAHPVDEDVEALEDMVYAEFADEDPEGPVEAEFADEDPEDPEDAEFVDEDPEGLEDAEFVDEDANAEEGGRS
ncbi:hypothetical protein [Streptomyces sp. NPDC003480]